MLDILNSVSDDLPPTRTYQRRSFVWLPSDGEMLGELIVKQQYAKSGVGRKLDLDTYGIDRDPLNEPGDNGGEAFWIVNLSDPDAEQPYRCVVGGIHPFGGKCTCKASQCKVTDDDAKLVCKHFCCLRYLIDNGILEPLDERESGSYFDPDFGEVEFSA
jgi:hypothetical protein